MTQDQAFKTRLALLEAAEKGLIKKAGSVQDKLFSLLVEKILEGIIKEEDGETILSDKRNFIISKVVDNIFNEFERSGNFGIARLMVQDFSKLANINDTYFGEFGINEKRYEIVRRKVRSFMKERIGIATDNSVKPGGYLDNLIRDQVLRSKVQNITLRAITTGQPVKDYVKGLRQLVVGVENVDGAYIKHLKAYANDTYSQFDRANNYIYATELKLSVFDYSGGIIEDSRDFCRSHEDKVYTIEETLTWKNDPDLPRTTAERESGIITDYDPITDMGRWNCRHTPRFISKAEALRRRPELKEYYESKERRRAA